MITPDQVAELLDGNELTAFQEDARIRELARSAGLTIVWAGPEGISFTGSMTATYPHAATGPLLINRAGRMMFPAYDGEGLTLAHADQLVRRRLAERIEVHASPARGPFWTLNSSAPHAAFTLLKGGRAYCRALVIAVGFLPAAPEHEDTFQNRTSNWVEDTFGEQKAADLPKRCDRFLEEVLEFLQAVGYDQSAVDRAAEYVYSRKPGDPMQEAGGVRVTFASLCEQLGFDGDLAGEVELARIETMVDDVRAKNILKPSFHEVPSPPRLALVK